MKQAGAAAVDALCEVGAIDTLLSNFIVPLQEEHIATKNVDGSLGRVHCSLNINTETGRLSARRPNLQNQPALEKDRYKVGACPHPTGCYSLEWSLDLGSVVRAAGQILGQRRRQKARAASPFCMKNIRALIWPLCEKTRPHLQVRQAFTADVAAGNTLVVADYGQLELRLLAHMTNCTSMLRAFQAGGDFHSRTALGMYDHIKEAIDRGLLFIHSLKQIRGTSIARMSLGSKLQRRLLLTHSFSFYCSSDEGAVSLVQ